MTVVGLAWVEFWVWEWHTYFVWSLTFEFWLTSLSFKFQHHFSALIWVWQLNLSVSHKFLLKLDFNLRRFKGNITCNTPIAHFEFDICRRVAADILKTGRRKCFRVALLRNIARAIFHLNIFSFFNMQIYQQQIVFSNVMKPKECLETFKWCCFRLERILLILIENYPMMHFATALAGLLNFLYVNRLIMWLCFRTLWNEKDVWLSRNFQMRVLGLEIIFIFPNSDASRE